MKSSPNQSDSYQALARRYRPRFFRDFVGIEHVTRTLQNAIRQGRVAHAYLFCGPRGIGKTSMVRVFAMALNCEKGPAEEPCGECDSCTRIHRGDDIDVIEIDGASHTGVDNVRELRSNAIYAPARSRYKIYAIDEVHMLSKPAFNALLKTLEEPPEHVKFLFATTEPQKVIETIQSRCQRFDFPRISPRDIAATLGRICESEKINASDKILSYIARNVRGGMRDALSILDQVIACCGATVEEEPVYNIMGSVPEETLRRMGGFFAEGDVKGALVCIGALFSAGKDPGEIVDALSNYLRDILVLKTCGDDAPPITAAGPDETMRAQAARFSADALLYMLQILGETRSRLRFIENQQILLEVAMVRLARWEGFESFDDVLGRLAEGAPPPHRVKSEPPGSGESAVSEPPARPETARRTAEQNTPPGEEPRETERKFGFGESSEAETWNKAVDTLFKKRGFLAAALAHGQLISFASEEATLGFPPEARFSMEQLLEPAKRRDAEEALGEIIGRKITLKVQAIEPSPNGPSPDGPSPDGRAPEGCSPDGHSPDRPSPESQARKGRGVPPIVEQALDIFEGEVVD